MKHITLIFVLTLATITAAAQSTNPLNYSGRMYVEAIEIIATPRYVSYEDHAILSQQMRIPSVEITKIDMDFEKGIVIAKEIEMKIKVNGCKKYDTDRGWVVVIYVDLVNEGDKAELVWPEFGKPFFQQITKTDDGVKIARMVLSSKPYVADESEALRDMLMGLGTM
ncbi:MAG: hypothetical protein K6D54_06930 [Bacteroidales bacterium]|nr:hypothetical protein [Bacteroidales bacterium]